MKDDSAGSPVRDQFKCEREDVLDDVGASERVITVLELLLKEDASLLVVSVQQKADDVLAKTVSTG